MPILNSQTVQLVIVAAVALTMLLQAIVLLAILMAVRKSASAMRQEIEELRAVVVPVIDNARELLAHTGPKIESTITDLAAISHNLRRQSADVEVAATEILDRVRRQSLRMDTMFTRLFDSVDRASSFMQDAVAKPMRQVSGILASAKAIVEALRTDDPHAPADHTKGDKDMFV